MKISNFPDGIITPNDLLLFESVTDNTYRKTIAGNISSNSKWQSITANYSANNYDRLICSGSSSIDIQLPVVSIGEIEILSTSSDILFDTQNKPYNGTVYPANKLKLQSGNNHLQLIYINDSVGWYPLLGSLQQISDYASGASLILDGSLSDNSGNNHTVTTSASVPSIITGFDNNPALHFDGSEVQQLSVSSFLGSATGATLYIVFSPQINQYNLIQTANLDDYWRFSGDGNAYMGTFKNSRFEGYPGAMPLDGNHLISIHASSNSYEVILDNISKGLRNDYAFNPGDRFYIAAENKRYTGNISLLIVYPFFIAPSNANHATNLTAMKSKFPSLPFTL